MGRQWIKSIELSNYRNLKHTQIEFSPDINIISGENAQGKTNLLEAIWLLSGGKSFRGSKDKDLILIGQEVCVIEGLVENSEGDEKLLSVYSSIAQNNKGRFGKINGSDFIRATQLAGNFYCVVFAPVHLSLVGGSPALRRKFMDACLCQLYPSFIEAYRNYSKYLNQKNYLLKEAKRQSKPRANVINFLDIFDEKLSELGYFIYLKRKQFCDIVSDYATEYYKNISSGKESINLVYQAGAKSKQELFTLFLNSREKDLKSGFSTTGIQREDIEITLDGLSAKDFASQGQQRSIALALKLAESDVIKKATGIEPVILLDDVLSELDFSRQDYLLHHITDKQVFITSCDEERIKLSQSKKFFVKNGEVRVCT